MPKKSRTSTSSSASADIKPNIHLTPSTPPRDGDTAGSEEHPSTPHIPETKPRIPQAKNRSPKSPGEKGQKTAWTADEDAILVGLLHDLIKTHLWGMIKADGRLVGRTSYGAQYHARGTNGKPTK